MTRLLKFRRSPDMSTSTDLELRFQTEPIVAQRLWGVTPFLKRDGSVHNLLCSVGVTNIWQGMRPLEARCQFHHHDAPNAGCHCGIWGLNDKRHLHRAMNTYASVYRAWGTINVWGHVLACRDGYRAEFAYPKQLYTDDTSLVTELQALYGVPVEWMERPVGSWEQELATGMLAAAQQAAQIRSNQNPYNPYIQVQPAPWASGQWQIKTGSNTGPANHTRGVWSSSIAPYYTSTSTTSGSLRTW